MRKHHSSTTQHYERARKLADELRLARIDAAVVEYAELLMDIDNFDFADAERRLREAKMCSGFPPTPKWILKLREERKQRAHAE